MQDNLGRILKVVGIIFMGLTGAMNLLGGIGTVCAAFLTENFPSMMALWDYRWLYQSLMIVTILVGLGGIWVTIRLAKGGDNVYRNALILLVTGTVVGAVHYYASMALRGSAAPANMKLYINILTLLLFLALKIPGISERVNFDRSADNTVGKTAAGLTAIMIGMLVISTSLWVGNSHVFEGVNWTHVLKEFLAGSGLASIGIGVGTMAAPAVKAVFVKRATQAG
jgi:hypothetical protein